MSELPPTERRNDGSADLDTLSTQEIVAALADDQRHAAAAVAAASASLARAVDAVASRLATGGRLHYVGAGTSGRLGVLDASEMPPTFGTEPSLVCAHIAGGDRALRAPSEGAEDDAAAGAALVEGHVEPRDAVVGISASGGARFVVEAIGAARALGAYTVAITNVDDSALATAAEHAIVLNTGAEMIAGSTRLKAGTSQKIALNVLSTAVMVRLGKTYGDLMVDVVASNEKLRARALRLVRTLAPVDDDRARALLDAANGSVKVAVVMAHRAVDAEAARALLDREGGMLRRVL